MRPVRTFNAVIVSLSDSRVSALLRLKGGRQTPIGSIVLCRDEPDAPYLPPAGPMSDWASVEFNMHVRSELRRGCGLNAPIVAAIGAVNAAVEVEEAQQAGIVR